MFSTMDIADLPGFYKDDQGNLRFELTKEEQEEVNFTFSMTKNSEGELFVKSEHADAIRNGMTAFSLYQYAIDQISQSNRTKDKEEIKKFVKKALAAIAKTVSIYNLPIYQYDFACMLEIYGVEVNGGREIAMGAFQTFLQEQSEYKPTVVDQIFLKDRNIEAAIADAKKKVDK